MAEDIAPLVWRAEDWRDPDGGVIRLLPHLPTVHSPPGLAAGPGWHGLALLATEEDLEMWQQQSVQEAESPGCTAVAMMTAMGGGTAQMLSGLAMLQTLQGAVFPDPEPSRLLAAAQSAARPVWLVEPDLDDEGWAALTVASAEAQVKVRNLLRAVTGGRRYRRMVKRVGRAETDRLDVASGGVGTIVGRGEVESKDESERAPTADELIRAAALTSAWWMHSRSHLDQSLRASFDDRLAARLRGALAELRDLVAREQVDDESPPEAILLAPVTQSWLTHLHEALRRGPVAERVECMAGEA